MKKLLMVGLPILIILAGLPVFAALTIMTMTTRAAAECDPAFDAGPASSADAGGLGIDGPGGGPVTGRITMATANIPGRVGLSGLQRSMPRVLSTTPDFVALQEVGQRSLSQIQDTAPGYDAYRDPKPDLTPGGRGQSLNNVILWRTEAWTRLGAGRVKIVEDDRGYLNGKAFVWDRFATWVTLQRRSDGAVVSAISVHQMTNPRRFPRQHGSPPLTRAQQYGQGMDNLLGLADRLSAHGPVLIAGDMNTRASYTQVPWSAAAKMSAAGYEWAHHGVDFVFFPHQAGVRLRKSWTGPMDSDHQWVAARLDMNGAGPTPSPRGSRTGAERSRATTSSATEPGAAHVRSADPTRIRDRLMRLRFRSDYPALTREQATNAMTIAETTRELGVPRRGLVVALATAIQESKLVNLNSGDRDSRGLFQQRPSQGWGTPAEVTNPKLATRAFYGRADHTNNTGLLDIAGWQHMPVTLAAQAVQRSAFPGAYAQWERVAQEMTDLLAPGPPGSSGSDGLESSGGIAAADCQPISVPASQGGCPPSGSPAEKGLSPDALLVLRSIDARFGSHAYHGVGDRSNNPGSDHPSGRAVDVMIENPTSPTGIEHGNRIAEWTRAHAVALGVTYIIWRKRIWSTGDTDWRPYSHPSGQSTPTLDHDDHVHVSVAGTRATMSCGPTDGQIVYPVPPAYLDSDRKNWHATGPSWDRWHTGTDFSVPCGTPVHAAHAGTVQIDTTQDWAGPWLVKVTTSPGKLTTWYAHMQSVTVTRGQKITVGQTLGEAGNLGNSHGCHLHFEVHLKGGSIYGPDNVDPSTWLAENASRPARQRPGRS